MSNEQSQKEAFPPADQLMAKPALSWAEWWQGVLGLPETTAEELAREPHAPKFFLLGRRRYIRREDALAYINSVAAARPYTPRKNNRRS